MKYLLPVFKQLYMSIRHLFSNLIRVPLLKFIAQISPNIGDNEHSPQLTHARCEKGCMAEFQSNC